MLRAVCLNSIINLKIKKRIILASSFFKDCGMIGASDQVIMVNCEETGSSFRTEDEKPRLSYTLAERTSLQVFKDELLLDNSDILSKMIEYRPLGMEVILPHLLPMMSFWILQIRLVFT